MQDENSVKYSRADYEELEKENTFMAYGKTSIVLVIGISIGVVLGILVRAETLNW